MQLDSANRITEIRSLIKSKAALYSIYLDYYQKYRSVMERSPPGLAVELGAGAGFSKEFFPYLEVTDLIPYSGMDRVVDATHMPYAEKSISAFLLTNVFHHIPDVEAFFLDAERCLVPGGRVLIIDQYPGILSKFIYKYAHHEDFDEKVKSWKFSSQGPLSGANGALAWNVFFRDRSEFEKLHPNLRIVSINPHSPLIYWFSGGLKSWNLIPKWAVSTFKRMDQAIVKIFPFTASFVDIELMLDKRN